MLAGWLITFCYISGISHIPVRGLNRARLCDFKHRYGMVLRLGFPQQARERLRTGTGSLQPLSNDINRSAWAPPPPPTGLACVRNSILSTVPGPAL